MPLKDSLPDVAIHRGSRPISDYNNPLLIPGMFPSLFPFGAGGFNDPNRFIQISLRAQTEHFLDLADPIFRRHRSFVFVLLNIHQRHTAHFHTSLSVRKSSFDKVAETLTSITPEMLNSVAKHLEAERKVTELPESQKKVLKLLEEVNAITTHLPGSKLDKLKIRNDIRAYMGYFGLPVIYLTLNPSATHSPIYQVMWGDDAVDLTKRFPDLASSSDRAIRLASDPAAAADFFDFSINSCFEHLLGWDHNKHCSKKQGGILGRLRAF
ncbi:hypothetical protein DL93DRAFT_2069047, partial [Clavulina sp. PMI_390]